MYGGCIDGVCGAAVVCSISRYRGGPNESRG